MMGSKAFESPLISHLRMRALYRALVEIRLLGERVGSPARVPHGLEACWVSTAIDLNAGDHTLDRSTRHFTRYIRDVGNRRTAGALTPHELRGFLGNETKAFPGSAAEHLLCSTGAAMALKAAGENSVVLAYCNAPQLAPLEWKRVLAIVGDGELPLVIVSVPNTASSPASVLRPAHGLPVIPVDASDAVALYRVAQESIHRARAGGGAAVIQCVPGRVDPIQSMGAQLVKKQICTQRWVDAVEAQIRALILRLEPH